MHVDGDYYSMTYLFLDNRRQPDVDENLSKTFIILQVFLLTNLKAVSLRTNPHYKTISLLNFVRVFTYNNTSASHYMSVWVIICATFALPFRRLFNAYNKNTCFFLASTFDWHFFSSIDWWIYFLLNILLLKASKQ